MNENGSGSKINQQEMRSLTCGLVMPISPLDGCSAEHWADVKTILKDSIESIDSPKFVTNLVSDASDVGIIQKRIVQGIYESDIVVCDVSGRNPNVMFELGMRLAFDKPTILIKDDKTDYSFDVNIIEHLTYPRDLRFNQIVGFKTRLAEKVSATYSAFLKDPNHSTFLKSFGTFKVAHIEQKEVSKEDLIFEILQELRGDVTNLKNSIFPAILQEKNYEKENRFRNYRAGLADKSIVKVINALTLIQAERASKNLSHVSEAKNLHELVIKIDPSISYDFVNPNQLEAAIQLSLDNLKHSRV